MSTSPQQQQPQSQQPTPIQRGANLSQRTQPANKTTSTTNMANNRRSERPRPLKLSHSTDYSAHNDRYSIDDPNAPVSLDEVLTLMHQVNIACKNGFFTSTLANQIFALYGHFKQVGELLEQNYKDELNRCFLSLRQACCRDSGQLGTPCRLKIMELIELRAMGWRPSLSHSQYYVNRGPPNVQSQEFQSFPEMSQAPISAPPFGTMTVNPFGFGSLGPQPAHDYVSASPSSNAMSGMPPTQYFLIPATAAPPGGFAFVSPNPAGVMGAQMGPNSLMSQAALMSPPPQMSTSPTVNGAPTTPWPKGAVMKQSGKFTHATKVPGKSQFKDEVIIKNADSGKIMGIKGRRVAIIEEISKTVVSFQKVPQGSKERCLTITGNTEESIEIAKSLIESTIRRNASPDREGISEEALNIKPELSEELDDDFKCAISAGDIGKLTLSGADPEIVEQAREILQDYFLQHAQLRRTVTDGSVLKQREPERIERRKSMPPIQAGTDVKDSIMEARHRYRIEFQKLTAQNSTPIAESNEDGLRSPNKKAVSTPNLAEPPQKMNLAAKNSIEQTVEEIIGTVANGGKDIDEDHSENDHSTVVREEFVADKTGGGGALVMESSRARVMMRVVYTREFLLQCASSPYCQLSPREISNIANNMPEIVRIVPGKFSSEEYKKFCQKLKAESLAVPPLVQA